MSASTTPRETVDLMEAAQMLGVSHWTLYDQARRGTLPVPVIRIGRRMVISRRVLEELLEQRKSAA